MASIGFYGGVGEIGGNKMRVEVQNNFGFVVIDESHSGMSHQSGDDKPSMIE